MTKLKKELSRFLVAGFSAVGTDLGSYYVLLNLLPHDPAKAISFILGTIVAFIINKYWTFEKHETSVSQILKFGILYTLTLGANVMTNNLVLDLSRHVLLSFLIATGVSTVLNFIGQKWWVFR
jgi:putative flippase GtrA